MLILSNTTFYTTKGNPTNLQLCPRGEWQDCILVETVLSRLMVAIYCKLVQHRVCCISTHALHSLWQHFICVCYGMAYRVDVYGFVPPSIVNSSLYDSCTIDCEVAHDAVLITMHGTLGAKWRVTWLDDISYPIIT
jgi:hypothetical protein